MLSSVVASQDERIKEIANETNLVLVEQIPLNFKVRVLDKPSPLKIGVSYFGAVHKSLKIYISHENKEPSLVSNMMSFLNPTTIVVPAIKIFEKEWLYMTIVSETDLKIKMVFKF